METEHNQYIRAQEALPYLERAAMLCKHYRGDSCEMALMPIIRNVTTEQQQEVRAIETLTFQQVKRNTLAVAVVRGR